MSERLLHATVSPLPYSRPDTPNANLQIGFLGLGSMGYLMARNLASHIASASPRLPPLIVYNRTSSKAQKLVEELGQEKVRISESPGQLAAECNVIITNLANDEVVKSIYGEFARAINQSRLTKSKLFIETSTIYPALAGELDALITSIPGGSLITSPVLGAPPAADKAQLIILMSGDHRSKKEAASILVPAVGRKVIDLGENLEKAPTFKLIGNSLILGSMEVIAESMTLAEKSGIGAVPVHELIKELLPAGILVRYGEKMAYDQFDGTNGFAIAGGVKDARHIRRLTGEHNSPMPAIDIAYQHLLTAQALHSAQKLEGTEEHEVMDWSAMVAGSRVAAGLDGFDSKKHVALVREESKV